jgi:hypothetical protein
MPILPEHRTLLKMQRDIEDDSEYGIRLDGAGDGSSCSILLIASLHADIDYNLELGQLVYDAAGAVTTKQGETLQVQLKMDACRAMSKIQQIRRLLPILFPMDATHRILRSAQPKCASSRETTIGTRCTSTRRRRCLK